MLLLLQKSPGQNFFDDIQTDRPIEWAIEATSRRLKSSTVYKECDITCIVLTHAYSTPGYR